MLITSITRVQCALRMGTKAVADLCMPKEWVETAAWGFICELAGDTGKKQTQLLQLGMEANSKKHK